MKKSLPSPQPAAARRAAEAELRALVAKFAAAHESLVGTARRWLRKRLPTAHEVAYEYNGFVVISFTPTGNGYEGVFALRGDADGVKLYFNQGRDLPDPENRLQGSGGQVRWIQVEGAATLRRPAVLRLCEEALAHNRVPFAREGRGSIVIRPTTAARKHSRG